MTKPHEIIYGFGVYELDLRYYQLRRNGKPVQLEPKVFDVLAYLVQHRDRLVTKEELLEHLWPEAFVGDAALVRCIVAARKATGDSHDTQHMIQTVRSRGYRFVAPVTVASTQAHQRSVSTKRGSFFAYNLSAPYQTSPTYLPAWAKARQGCLRHRP